MRKLMLACALFAIYSVVDVKFTDWSNLSGLPAKLLPDTWVESISQAIPIFPTEETLEAEQIIAPEPIIPLHKPFSELTVAEREVKQRLELQMLDEIPNDVIIKTNGTRIDGDIIEETSTQVRFRQNFRGAGTMLTWVPRSSIREIIHAEKFISEVSYRDVHYQMEFPNLGLYIRPPFSILTEKNFFDVESAVNLLDGLHSQFLREFRTVMQESERANGIQLLFFSEEEDFESYRDQFATNLGYSVGFYSPRKDRLVIYDQQTSNAKAKIVEEVEAITTGYQKQHGNSSRHRNAATRWSREVKRELSVHVGQSTQRILRHEGAHQLFSTYGVHSAHGAEHLWLIEGLAVYCESMSFGSRPDHLLSDLPKGLLPFPKLVNFGDLRGFGELGDDETIGAAYALSGLMTYVFMQPEFRGQFFQFIRLLQDPAETDRIRETSQFELLSKTLGLTPRELEQRLTTELRIAASQI